MKNRSAELDDLITQAEAARLRQVSRSAIFDLVRRGRLDVIRVGGRAFVSRSEVLQLARAKTGPKPKSQKTKGSEVIGED